MRWNVTCVKCGDSQSSPEGRDPREQQDFLAWIDEVGLVCRKCGGELDGSEEK